MSRTRTTESAKSRQTAQENEDAAARKAAREQANAEKAAERARAKEDREAKRKAEAEARQKEREERAAAKERAKAEAERDLLESGALIRTDAAEFHEVVREETPTVEQRANDCLAYLKENATETPILGRDLADEFGGGWPQWLSFFAMLKALGLVREYRSRTGTQGGSGIAYLYIGDK